MLAVVGVALALATDDSYYLDVAATDTTNFLGVAFRAAGPRFSNVVFLRPGASGSEEAVQYGPAFNSVGVAWQVYHGEGANAAADVPRNRWVHLRLCQECGHVGCCDNSPGKHATKHFHRSGHPLMRSYEPGEDWSWCYVDELMFRMR